MNKSIANLESLIAKKETQLYNAEQESVAWNSGKYKNSSNAKMSLILVESLRKEIAALYEELQLAKGT